MKAPVCPQIPTANSAVENLGLRAGVGPAERAFLSSALSSVRGLRSRPPAGTRACHTALHGAVTLPLGPPPSRAPLTTSRLPVSGPPLLNPTVASRLAPSSPLRWTPPALTWPTGDTHLTPSLCLSPSPCPPCSASLTFFWSFIPSFLFSGLLATSPSKLHHPLLEAFLGPDGQRRLSTSHLGAYTVACTRC